MISATSESYPIHGAARAAGVPYAMALAYVDAASAPDSWSPAANAWAARRDIVDRFGIATFWVLEARLMPAWRAGLFRMRWLSPDTDGWAA